MILLAAKVMKVLLFLAAVLVGYVLFRKRLSARELVCLGVLTVVAAIAANNAAGLLPPLTDQVTLTALGERREEAQKEEVLLDGYTVDDEEFIAGKSLEIEEGHWFWYGESYCWRIETDPRQPEGVTRTVVLRIPVGWVRTLNFNGSVWRGKVQITAGGNTWIKDTYAEESRTISEGIGSSEKAVLILNQARYLMLYTAVLLGLSVLAAAAVIKNRKLLDFCRRHRGPVIFAAIAVGQFLIALHFSGVDGFWYDELYEIGWSVEKTSLLDRAFSSSAPLPIFGTIFALWYPIAPYGEQWLLLLSEIGTAVGVFFVGMCGKEYEGDRTGILASLCAAGSGVLLTQCSYENRNYAFYFASSAVLLYLYLRSYRETYQKNPRNIFLMSAVMIFFAGMHWHAVVHCIALFLIDVIAYFRFNMRNRSIIPYLAAAISYIPNIIYVLRTRRVFNLNFEWHRVPSWESVVELISYLAGNSDLLVGMFLLGASVLLSSFVLYRVNVSRNSRTLRIYIPALLIAIVVTFFVIYGTINPKATLWQPRYFCDLFPCFFVLCGFGAATLSDWICKGHSAARHASSAMLLFSCLLILHFQTSYITAAGEKVKENYRGAADYLYEQANYIYNDTTLVLSADPSTVVTGWNEYYLTRQGRRDVINVASRYATSAETLLQYDRIYVLRLHSSYLDEPQKNVLDESYKKIDERTNYRIAVYQKRQ